MEVLDLEGFFIIKTFHARELGYFTWNQEHGRHAFFVPVPYKILSDKDKQTVNFVISKIHRLPYPNSQTEHAQNPRFLGTSIKDSRELPRELWWATKEVSRGKDVFKQLNIPSLNLDTAGCPKYDVMKYQPPPPSTTVTLLPSCSFHANESMHHCPVMECSSFWH